MASDVDGEHDAGGAAGEAGGGLSPDRAPGGAAGVGGDGAGAEAGEHQVQAEFAYDGGGLAKGGTVTLYYDGEQTGQGTLAATAPIGFSPNETAGIGHELGTTVLPGTAPADTVFNGKISWVRLTTGQPDNSDMVDPEDVINLLMAEQ